MAATSTRRVPGQTDLLGGEHHPASQTLEAIACGHLADWMQRNGNKRPTVTKEWLASARRLREIDGRTHEQIMACIDWCQRDEFWQGNIHSMPTLRRQYDKLRAAACRERKNPRTPGAKKDAQRDLMAKFRAERMARGAA